jgi:hypothetical protein
MAYYRVYLLNEADRIADGHWLERDGDAEAITGAVALARTRSVEVWCGSRKVAGLSAAEVERQHHATPRTAPKGGRPPTQKVGTGNRTRTVLVAR